MAKIFGFISAGFMVLALVSWFMYGPVVEGQAGALLAGKWPTLVRFSGGAATLAVVVYLYERGRRSLEIHQRKLDARAMSKGVKVSRRER